MRNKGEIRQSAFYDHILRTAFIPESPTLGPQSRNADQYNWDFYDKLLSSSEFFQLLFISSLPKHLRKQQLCLINMLLNSAILAEASVVR